MDPFKKSHMNSLAAAVVSWWMDIIKEYFDNKYFDNYFRKVMLFLGSKEQIGKGWPPLPRRLSFLDVCIEFPSD